MPQGILNYQYEAEKKQAGLTAWAGLPVYLDLARVLGLSESVQKYVRVREGTQGYADAQMITALVLLNLAGGDCVDDLRVLGRRRFLSRLAAGGTPGDEAPGAAGFRKTLAQRAAAGGGVAVGGLQVSVGISR